MADFHDAYVYVGTVKVASTTYSYSDDRLFSDVTVSKPRGGKVRARASDCGHENRRGAYAFVPYLDQHWPIEFCDDCLTILRGRSRYARYTEDHKPVWERTQEDAIRDVLATRWNEVWPRDGMPRRKTTKNVVWPDDPA